MIIVCHLAAQLALSTLRAVVAAKISPTKHILFTREFAPSEGLVDASEQPFRQEMCLNGSWLFQPAALPSSFVPDVGAPPVLAPPTASGWDPTAIKIPSPWNVNAFNVGSGGDFRCFPSYPKSWESVQMGWLRHTFRVPATWTGKRLLLHFDAIDGNADVYVNGRKVGQDFDLFLPAEYDVTDEIKPGASNEVLVGIQKASLFDDQRTIWRYAPVSRRIHVGYVYRGHLAGCVF